eukprot:SAG22_NODE_10668_length_521_cov_3.649289_1_plen_105_part_10
MPPAAAGTALPPNWELHTSRSTGDSYYFNTLTGASTYEFPDPEAQAQEEEHAELEQAPPGPGPPGDPPLPWTTEVSSGGQTYYFNAEEMSWAREGRPYPIREVIK